LQILMLKNSLISLLFICLFVLFSTSIKAQISPFNLTFGDSNINEKGIASLQLSDGSILMIGNTDATENNNSDISLTKFTVEGQVLWSKRYGTPNNDYANNVTWMQDGNIAIVAETHDIVGGNVDGAILVLDIEGNELWLKTYGEINVSESFYHIDQTSDNSLIVCGFVTGEGFGNDHYATKISQEGEVLWSKAYGSQKNETGVAIRPINDGGYFLIDDKQQKDNTYAIEALKLDKNGNVLWQLDINDFYNGGCKNIIINSEGDYIIVGEASPKNGEGFEVMLIKLSHEGNLIWKKFIDGTKNGDAGFDIAELSDSQGYIVTGYGFNSLTQQTDVLVIQVDLEGQEIERYYYGAEGFDIAYDVIPLIDGGFWVTGSSYEGIDNQYFLAYGHPIAVNIEPLPSSKPKFMLYPNPLTNSSSILQLGLNHPLQQVEILLLDSSGNILLKQYHHILENLHLPRFLTSGTYILQLNTPQNTFHQKVIIH
ncbi:MAG: T9SS type A sorting domain-containing protein, partial [Chitinophagales bacterium]